MFKLTQYDSTVARVNPDTVTHIQEEDQHAFIYIFGHTEPVVVIIDHRYNKFLQSVDLNNDEQEVA